MTLSQRIALLVKLGSYMQTDDTEWRAVKEQAFKMNGWFLPEFIDLAVTNIATRFLQEPVLKKWTHAYPALGEQNPDPKLIGLVMAGNIPLVGFHDFLCIFITGNKSLIKASSKDETLIVHLVKKMAEWEPETEQLVSFSTLLKGCDAYIATGSDNTAGYFEYYFSKYPSLIRRNRTSAAVLTGKETDEELSALADDVFLYFGMGCRNVTKLFVPENYNFENLLTIFKKYDYLSDVHKYKNNYDYNLALYILNKRYYMSTAALLLVEDPSLFSPVSQLNYGYYENRSNLVGELVNNASVQCIVATGYMPFGTAQSPAINQYADGEDTLQFLLSLQQ